MDQIKNIYYKALKLINRLKLTDEIDITVCFAKEDRNAFYFVLEDKNLNHYCFALTEWYDVLCPKISGLFLESYEVLERAVSNFIKIFKH